MTRLGDLDFSDLSRDERLRLAQRLLDSVLTEDEDLTAEQLGEMRRRLDDIESGRDTPVPWEAVRAGLP